MKAYVYRGDKDPAQLLVLPEKNNFTSVPKDVRDSMGPVSLFKVIDLEPGQERIVLDTARALSDMEKNGYHLENAVVRLNLFSSDRVAVA
jgi:uncharacterized protein YcgL (UPF0745 family)